MNLKVRKLISILIACIIGINLMPIRENYIYASNEICQNILNNTSLGLSVDKKRTLSRMADMLLSEGYEPAFVAGMLGNFSCEGSFGRFESSNYSNYSKEPDYLKYMDKNWNYRAEYSGKSIVGKSLSKVYSMICSLDAKNYRDHGSRCGFGLGCAQWTFGRTKGLIEKYMEIANNNDTITSEQAIEAEGLYMVSEINGSFNYVYQNWKRQNNGNFNSALAANNAGKIVCAQYEKPFKYENKKYARGEMAEKIYNACFIGIIPLPLTWTSIDADYRLTVRESLPLRSSYSATSSKLADMPAGSIVHVIENGGYSGGYYWAHVTWNGKEGYCNQAYLEKCDIADPPSVGIEAGTSFTDTVIKWNVCNNAVRYEVKVDGVSRGMTDSTSYAIRLGAGDHTTEVISYSNNGSASSSGVKGFTVNKTYPEKANIEIHAGNSKSTTYLSWNNCNYADSYSMTIYNASGTAVVSKSGSFLNFETKLTAGSYYAVVTTHNNTDNTDTTSDRKNFSIEPAVPATPTLNVLPGNNYTDTSFSWNACEYADNYRLEVTNKDTNQQVLNKTLNDTSYSQIFSTAGNYTGKVYAVNTQDNIATPSQIIDFYVESADCTEFDLSVAGRSDSVVVLDWTVSEHATQYDVYRYENGKYVLIGTTAETTFTDAGLYVDTAYQYYVKASNQWTEMDSNEVETETIILKLNGSGSQESPYIIHSVEDLETVRDLVNDSTTTKVFGNACYQLAEDLDLSSVNWTPIGTESCPFNGTFNGNYDTISGVDASIFGYCGNAVIENMVVYGAISSKDSNVGGIVGRIENGQIENCAFYGTVSGVDNVGGIVGAMQKESNLIRCYQIGEVSGNNAVGGIVGQTDQASLSSCYHAGGTVNGTGKTGGIAGQQNGVSSYADCYYLKNSSAYGVSGSTNAGVVAVNETVLKNLTETLGDPFTANDGYPIFSWEIKTYEFKGDGTSSSPYQIGTIEDLQHLSTFVSDPYLNAKYGKAYYIQTADIDMSGISWTPIGTKETPFNGNYNGGYRTIKGLSSDAKLSYGGLFGYCEEVSIENLIVTGTVSASEAAGGILGVSVNSCNLKEVAFIGTVNGNNAGGLVGKLNGKSTILQSYHNGAVKGATAGGLVGQTEYDSSITTETFFIRNSYHTNGTVSGTKTGGIIGGGSGYELENCFYLKNSTNSTANGTAANETVMRALSETIESPFTDNNDTTVNNGYPVFSWQISRYEFEGTGTKEDPYLIWTAEGLTAMQEYVNNPAYHDLYANAYYEQVCDIDLGDVQWTPIGMSEKLAFNGVYDGNGFTVYGLSASGETYSGLFGQVGATVNGRNAGIYNIVIEYGTSSSSTGIVGGTAAVLMNGATAESCAVIGDLYGDSEVGGVIGVIRGSGTITNSYHNGNVSGNSNIGGILGSVESGTARIENCYHTVGSVEGTAHTGAIVGYVGGAVKISNCYYLTGTCGSAVDGKSNSGVRVENETNLKVMAPELGEAYIDNIFETYFNDGYPIFAIAAAYVNEGETVSGDVNADGVFDLADVVLFQKWLLAVPNTKMENWTEADFIDDGQLNVLDLCLMKQALMFTN